jgi:arsenate reductase
MAETFLNCVAGDRFFAESAGLDPRDINPLVKEAMKEIGFDLDNNKSDSVFEFFKEGRLYDYVITVCDEATEKQCPIFPGIRKRLHWPIPDPQELTGNREEKMEGIRRIRDEIRSRIENWIKETSFPN